MKKFLKIAILILATFTTPVYADVIAPDWMLVDDSSDDNFRYLFDRNSVVDQDNGFIIGISRQVNLKTSVSSYEMVRIAAHDCYLPTKSGEIALADVTYKNNEYSTQFNDQHVKYIGAPKVLIWSERGGKIFDMLGLWLCAWKVVKDQKAQDDAIDSDKSYWEKHSQ